VTGLNRRSRIGWHERRTIIRGLAEDGRILTHHADVSGQNGPNSLVMCMVAKIAILLNFVTEFVFF
jgi:hypothetical protein